MLKSASERLRRELRILLADAGVSDGEDGLHRLALEIQGLVQGVGFRPFVYRVARSLGLSGWICNTTSGVSLELQGSASQLDEFLCRLDTEKPGISRLDVLSLRVLVPVQERSFVIVSSRDEHGSDALILPDLVTCEACVEEVFSPENRRYRYPFTNCTDCGPRYTIIEGLPYDRPATSMKRFTMCASCQKEYDDPQDRRFHAQPNACPACGPQLQLLDPSGHCLAVTEDALDAARGALLEGKIVALKGLGGYQLLVDASDEGAIERLRARKRRPRKPLAVMCSTLHEIEQICFCGPPERALMCSVEGPIVLLKRREDVVGIAEGVAPGLSRLGVMLPTTPLHHLLLRGLERPFVVTSGNVSGQPLCIDEEEALGRLGGIADLFLVHDRPVLRPVDDSVGWVIDGEVQWLRRARGLAPLPLELESEGEGILAVGAHQKSTWAFQRGKRVWMSPYIGDLDSVEAQRVFRLHLEELQRIRSLEICRVCCDLHPEYGSTQIAEEMAFSRGLPLSRVQHHEAHAYACMAEYGLEDDVLAVVWDGTGWGRDGTIWGGEWFLRAGGETRRCAQLRPFRLAGGDRAIREPRRSALGLLVALEKSSDVGGLVESWGDFEARERVLLLEMLEKGLRSPVCSSMGRLFDGISALLGWVGEVTYEGEAAIALEAMAEGHRARSYAFGLDVGGEEGLWIVDWGPVVEAIVRELAMGVEEGEIAAGFQRACVEVIVALARRFGVEKVLLTGGCFQNAACLEGAIVRLREEGFCPIWPRKLPPNDAGIALGQLWGLHLQRSRKSGFCGQEVDDTSGK